MNRKFTSYPVQNFSEIKPRMLNWAKQFNIYCFLDNHQYNFFSSFECLLAVDVVHALEVTDGNAFDALQEFKEANDDWLFGHLSYDLKNHIEHLSSANIDEVGFPDIYFFVPKILLLLSASELRIGVLTGNADKIIDEISAFPTEVSEAPPAVPALEGRYTKDEYLSCVKQLRRHIQRGDCYEINFCQEFFSKNAVVDPIHLFRRLSAVSPNPFSALYNLSGKYLLCASPERYLKKIKNRIYSQPIKGTSKREPDDAVKDQVNRLELFYSGKERSENVMIVDLVRNDLSKICEEGSVTVDQLYEVYSFPQVHQMISTVSGNLRDSANSLASIFKATFPMGSMTGAPKKRVMELIEKYEKTKRGIFSGSVGYVTPGGDFDFNVVIRSILYNSLSRYLSIQAGSAITFNSVAEKEYEECFIKIAAMQSILQ